MHFFRTAKLLSGSCALWLFIPFWNVPNITYQNYYLKGQFFMWQTKAIVFIE